MLRVLFCATCCGTSKPSRPVQKGGGAGASNNIKSQEALEKPEEANFKSLLTLGEGAGEKSRLLGKWQPLDNYGAEEGQTEGKLSSSKKLTSDLTNDPQLLSSKPGDTTTDSALALARLYSGATLPSNFDSSEFADCSTKETHFYEEGSVSTPSSIDVESFKESPNGDYLPPAQSVTEGSQQAPPQLQAQPPTSLQPEEAEALEARKSVAGTTKIGDYARIEYSPVEDLDSITTISQGGKSERPPSGAQSRAESPSQRTESVSRRSSQGIESTSISIASQLSNEQLQQNLTNMLESANSPIQLFGTIGLPLGPPLDGSAPETAKTSPETPGAALTSASQDSLSDAGLLESAEPAYKRRPSSGQMERGAALVAQDSVEVPEPSRLEAPRPEENPAPPAEPVRLESSLSMATTASSQVTSPTPTPSEGSQKKKPKLKAKALFKKWKPGKKKKKDDEADNNSNK